jgi:diguanylate cyclase (GGDEF)-like protein
VQLIGLLPEAPFEALVLPLHLNRINAPSTKSSDPVALLELKPMNRIRGTRSAWYAVAGAILSLGAPAGLLILRELYARRPVLLEVSSDRLTYVYVFIATAIVLASLGFVLGRQADKLAALSQTDVLTGLPNRRALRRRLTDEFRRSLRYGTPVSLMLIDIDGLKQMNDHAGHAAGDRLIQHVADAIHLSLRESDFGARWGGDEFGVVAPNTGADAARSSAERLRARVAARPGGQNIVASVSIGTATFDPAQPKHADMAALLQAADAALYRAKTTGRNRVEAA